ncbi:histone deacetylase [Pseudoalteromonas rhizosphaerae]|uniref:histone deacetylase family protein n=1 Tax=Pseudoalteromonas rhizosphaerae TaxID=2518973 RepID=UPI003703CFA8
MTVFYHPLYSALELPLRHRFPIAKYKLLKQEIAELGFTDFISPNKATNEQLQLCHSHEYVERFISGQLTDKEIKKMGFPWSNQLVERTLFSVGASIQASEYALKTQLAVNLSGGYHHAYNAYGSGFCIFNDLAVAAAHLINTEQASTVLIFDCDVHQGDGTAEICGSLDGVISCSIHCQQNFPRLKQHSDYDFSLNTGCSDNEYLKTVANALAFCIRLHQPDIILYNAGADICSQDELGYFDVRLEGVYQRDSLVLATCKQHSIPLMCALGGGYQRDTQKLVEVHKLLFQAIVDLYPHLV